MLSYSAGLLFPLFSTSNCSSSCLIISLPSPLFLISISSAAIARSSPDILGFPPLVYPNFDANLSRLALSSCETDRVIFSCVSFFSLVMMAFLWHSLSIHYLLLYTYNTTTSIGISDILCGYFIELCFYVDKYNFIQ